MIEVKNKYGVWKYTEMEWSLAWGAVYFIGIMTGVLIAIVL